jgi:serine/threonine protein kinase
MAEETPESPAAPPVQRLPRASSPSSAAHSLAGPAAPDTPTNSGIGKYRLVAELGRGGMADVFLAMAAGPGGFSKLLVLKQLRVGDDPTLVAMFLDEARLAARVSHPNIVQTFEVVHEHSRAFMVMEFLDGPSLSRLRRAAVKRGERVPLKVELKILCDALLGLHYAHELRGYDGHALGVVHRDFTPQNLLITYAGDVKIVDFGIAKALDQQTLTSAGMFKGKLTYVPPEQLMAHPVDRRADVFSAGVMLYEAVLGESPWKDLNNAAVTHALASGHIPKLIESAGAPPELADICDAAMAVDPDDRYATADDLRIALEAFIHDEHLELDRVQLGLYVDSLLGDERERTRQIIDQQLKQLTSLPTADTLVQTLPTIDGLTPAPRAKVKGRSVQVLMASEASPDTGRVLRPPAPAGNGPLLLALAIVILVLAGVVVLLLTRAQPGSVATPTAATAAPMPVVAAVPQPADERHEPPVAAMVSVRIQASPPIARLFLDGLELAENPFQGEFPHDSSLHELRITAPGCIDVERTLQFERDVTLDVTLARAPVAARPAPAPAPAPDPAPAPAPPPPKADPKPVEDSDFFLPSGANR